MDSLLEFLLEAFLQLFGELFFDAACRSQSPIVRTATNAILAVAAAALLSVLSLALHRHHLIGNPMLRLTALLVFPFLNGLLLVAIGRAFEKRGRARSGFEHFLPAFLFSLVFGALRFFGAR